MKRIRIADRAIGQDEPCFIIAEAGINHNGKLELARELITAAAKAGVDAVKFQTFKAEALCSRNSQYFELFKNLEFDKSEWAQIAETARSRRIIFLSTASDEASANLLDDLGIPAFKVSSGDLTHLPFLEHVARKKKPVILSTGIATPDEIDEALKAIYATGNKDVILLHCIASYPAPVADMNLKAINTLGHVFKVPVGLSDHTIGILVPVAAVSLGAKVIEKHFTLDKTLPGPDQKLSLDPVEFSEMVKNIRTVELALGSGAKAPSEAELKARDAIRRSITAKEPIRRGTSITRDMLKVVRPGTGIEPKYINNVVGRIAKEDIQADEILTWDKI